MLRWLEDCAAWCCEGWRTGSPRFSRIASDGSRLFAEALFSDERRQAYKQNLVQLLWNGRQSSTSLHSWLTLIYNDLLRDLLRDCRSLADEIDVLKTLTDRTGPGERAEKMTIGEFCGRGEGGDRINLSTLHSSKGREFSLVVMFAMDNGRIPWLDINQQRVREFRRLFYVGFTRAKRELHLMYSNGNPSPFVKEVNTRLLEDANG